MASQDPIPTDYDIAQSTDMEPIWELVEPWGLGLEDLQYFGEYTAKAGPVSSFPGRPRRC